MREGVSKYHYKRGHYRPTSETPFKWRADDGPIFNVGMVALRILKISGDPGQFC